MNYQMPLSMEEISLFRALDILTQKMWPQAALGVARMRRSALLLFWFNRGLQSGDQELDVIKIIFIKAYC